MATLSGFLKKTYAKDISNNQSISPFASQYSQIKQKEVSQKNDTASPITLSNNKNIQQRSDIRDSEGRNKIELSPIKRTPSLGKMFNQINSKFKRMSVIKELEQSINPNKIAHSTISEKKIKTDICQKILWV